SALTERERLAHVTELREHREVAAWPGVLDTYLELALDLGISDPEQYDRVLFWKRDFSDSRSLRSSQPQAKLLLDHARARQSLHRLLATRSSDRRLLRTSEAAVNELERQLRTNARDQMSIGNQPTISAPKAADMTAACPEGMV